MNYLKTKWTSVKKINGWRHYEVRNVHKKNKKLELFSVCDKVDLFTGTFGKSLGGASGGYVSGKSSVIRLLRQKSRPYLFSNSLAPMIVASSIKALQLVERSDELRKKLHENTTFFREGLKSLGFQVAGDSHPIIPIMLGGEKTVELMSKKLLENYVYAVGFSYPVVPKGQSRIRTQMSSAHSKKDLEKALEIFSHVGKEVGVISKRF